MKVKHIDMGSLTKDEVEIFKKVNQLSELEIKMTMNRLNNDAKFTEKYIPQISFDPDRFYNFNEIVDIYRIVMIKRMKEIEDHLNNLT